MKELNSSMLIERFFTPGLAQVAYAIADQEAGVAAIIDPRRDVDAYLRWAEAHEVRIEAILETHVHADFVCGARELAEVTGAPIRVSRRGEQLFATDYLDDGDDVPVGSLRLKALATPGHTPEHIAFLLLDPKHVPEPIALFSGDALFVGEVGRPDLLGEAQTLDLARQLYRTVQRLKELDDTLIVYPGHTAGSSCGKKIGDAPTTTIGQEKFANYAFNAKSEEEFIEKVLAGMTIPPTYYPVLKQVNKVGPTLLRDLMPGAPLTTQAVREKVESGALIIDARTPAAFGADHIVGAHFAGLGPDFTAWTGWLAPFDRDVILVLERDDQYAEARTELHRIGLDRVSGYLAGGMAAWFGERTALAQVGAEELASRNPTRNDELVVLDVRSDEEWQQGHIIGAVHQFAGELARRRSPLVVADTPAAVICGSGYRSTVVVSLLEAQGYRHLVNVTGGMDAWGAARLPVERGNLVRKIGD